MVDYIVLIMKRFTLILKKVLWIRDMKSGHLFMFLLSLLLLRGIVTMHAQTAVTTLRGCVKTDANSPVSGINVFVSQLNQRYTILGASLTD